MAGTLLRTDITLSVDERYIEGRKRYIRGTMSFGDGYKSFPYGGLTIPALSAFGFHRSIDEMRLTQQRGSTFAGLIYDSTRNVLIQQDDAEDESGFTTGISQNSPLPAVAAVDTIYATEEVVFPVVYYFMAVGW